MFRLGRGIISSKDVPMKKGFFYIYLYELEKETNNNTYMKFTVSTTELLKSLLDVSKAIPAKSTLPILENFLLVVDESGLEITASDSELTLRTRVAIDNASSTGKMAVPARHMMDLLKSLPDQPIEINAKDESFEVRWATGNSTLPLFPAGDYPEIKGVEDNAETFTIPAQTLVEGIASTVYATADDEMRPAMNGIFFDLDTASSTLVASDQHKLICYTTTEAQVAAKGSFILHKKPAAVLRSIIGKDVETVNVCYDQNFVQFKFDDTLMICRLVAGKFPRYRDVIPQNNSNILKIDRQQFLGIVKRVSVCANKASNHIKLDLKAGQLEISAQDLGFAIAAYEKTPCEYNGDELSIGFKSPFLVDILSNISCETIVMKFADARRAALIVPSEEEDESEKICGILMPIMIS